MAQLHRLHPLLLGVLAACGPAVSASPPPPPLRMSTLEATAAGCWLVTAPTVKGQTWHLHLDSAGWRADSAVSLRTATSIDAPKQFGGGRAFWMRSIRYPDSLEVNFGFVPGNAMMLRLAPGMGGLRGTAWGLEDVAPMQFLIGPAALAPAPCAT